MARVVLFKDEIGELRGLTDADERAYQRFIALASRIEVGATIAFSFSEPRSPEYHRAHFALLKLFYDHQEVFDDASAFRCWAEVGAGHCDFVPGPDGGLIAIPRSIAFEKLEEADFREHHRRVIDFLVSARAYQYLWPDCSPEDGERASRTLLVAYESQGRNETPISEPER